MKAFLAVLVVLTGLGAILFWALRDRPVSVEVGEVAPRTLVQALDEDGLVRSRVEVDCAPLVAARLTRICVEPGQEVRKGQLLAELESLEPEASLEQALAQEKAALLAVEQASRQLQLTRQRVAADLAGARAGLAASRAQQERTEAGPRSEQLKILQAAAEAAGVRYQETQRDFTRRRELFEKGAVSRADLEVFESNFKAADYGYQQARARLEEGRRGAVIEERKLAQAEVDRAQAGLQGTQAQALQAEVAAAALEESRARLELARAQVRQSQARLQQFRLLAPAQGRVELEPVQVGSALNPGQVVMRLSDPQQMYVELLLDEGDRGHARPGAEVRVMSDAYPGEEFQGHLKSVEGQAFLKRLLRNSPTQDEDRVFRARVEVPGAIGKLYPGMSVYAQLVLERRQEVLSLPRQACINREGQWIAYRLKGQKVQRRVIEVGQKDSSHMEVLAGLEAGDKVVLNPGSMSDGAPVTLSP